MRIKNIPNEKWTLARLGKFCVQRRERMAIDAWSIGKAMTLAKVAVQKEGKSFTEWKDEHGFTNATVSRYMRLYSANRTEKQRDRLVKLGVMEALKQAGVTGTKARNEGFEKENSGSQGDVSACPSHIDSRGPSASKCSPAKLHAPSSSSPSWAVDSAEDRPESQQHADDDHFSEFWSSGDTLQEELSVALPTQLNLLVEKVELLLDSDTTALRDAWPVEPDRKETIQKSINDLLRLLPELAATLDELGSISTESEEVAVLA